MLDLQTCFRSEWGGRERNEDAFGYWTSDGGGCWVVSDGAGGHGGGDVAARLVASTVLTAFAQNPAVGPDEAVLLLQIANDAVVSEKGRSSPPSDMHATAAVLLIDREGGCAVWGHVGDTRIYLLRRGRVVFQTRDHSVAQSMVDAGYGSAEMIRSHPQRNLLTSAMGSRDGIALSVSEEPMPLLAGDVFLLCTDGWWEHVQEGEMEHLLDGSTAAEDWLAGMCELILGRSTADSDNYTALCVTATEAIADETTVILESCNSC